jgi:Na+/melibiose symporter-like transporter
LWLPNLLAQLLSLAVMILAAKRIRASYTAYFIAYFVVTMGATWLLSAPRYLAAMLSLPAAMSALAENARTERVLILLSALLFFVYFIFFLLRWQVW